MQVDHLVWWCGDLAEGAARIGAVAELAPAYGGEHPGEGTANWLLGLGPSTYLEILGRDVKQPAAALDPTMATLPGTGLYHWAVSGADLHDLKARTARAGLTGGELVSGGRTKPDGSWLGWTCFGLRDHGFGALIPFFIDWQGSQHPAATAPRGAQLAALRIESPEAAELQAIYSALALPFTVKPGPVPRIVARLESGRGAIELETFSPLPGGYVI